MVSFPSAKHEQAFQLYPRYVLERTEDHISVWFWGRHDKNVPRDVKSGSLKINPKEFVSTGLRAPRFSSKN